MSAPGTTIQAGQITAPRRVAMVRVEPPVAGPDEVLIRLEGCGVCGSSGPLWQGRDWFDYPLRAGSPGHEGWGRIAAVGAGVSGLQTGQRVAFLSDHAFAEYDVARCDGVVPLPAELDHVPFPGEAIGCALNVFERSAAGPGSTVAVVGIGFLGAIVAALAVQAGARVIALSRRTFALDVARQLGADLTIPLSEPRRAIERIRRATAGALCDVVVEAVGLQLALDVAAEATREGGRLVIAGYHQDGLRQVNLQLWNWRAFEVVNAHERDRARRVDGMRRGLDAVRSSLVPLDTLLTHRVPLDDLGAAFAALEQRPDGFLKAVVRA